MHVIFKVLFFMWQSHLTNKPYVYSFSYTYEFSQINKGVYKYEKTS
jgi:hypothetical protein